MVRARRVLVCVSALVFVVGCDRGLNGENPGGDFSPPSFIDDLHVKGGDAAADALTLEWSAPSADLTGSDEPASRYEVYWGEETISQLNADTMTRVDVTDAPKAPGATESFRVTGLPQGPTLFFAVAAYDAADNVSFSIDTTLSAQAATAGAACANGTSTDEVVAYAEAGIIRFQGCDEYAGNLLMTEIAGTSGGGFSSLSSLSSMRSITDGVWADWEEIVDANASLTLYGMSTVTSLSELTSLEEVELLIVGVSDTPDSLTDIAFPALKKTGNAFFAGLPSVTTARLPALETTVNVLDFDGLEAATRIELPAADRIEAFYAENNELLTTISIPNVSHIESFDLTDNPNLETLDLPETFTAFSIGIEGCPKLDPCALKTRFEGLLTEDGTDVVYLDIEGMDACP